MVNSAVAPPLKSFLVPSWENKRTLCSQEHVLVTLEDKKKTDSLSNLATQRQ